VLAATMIKNAIANGAAFFRNLSLRQKRQTDQSEKGENIEAPEICPLYNALTTQHIAVVNRRLHQQPSPRVISCAVVSVMAMLPQLFQSQACPRPAGLSILSQQTSHVMTAKQKDPVFSIHLLMCFLYYEEQRARRTRTEP
jgi:hypothetical protein